MTPFLLIVSISALIVLFLRWRFLSFQGQSPSAYRDLEPEFDLRTYLSGAMLCEGVIYGPTGKVVSRFTADMIGEWEGDQGTLRERFHYDSGAMQQREWRLQLDGEGGITAEADDIIGVGRGRQVGPAVQMRYRLRLPEDAGGHCLDTIDWMYLTADGVILNRSQFRKFGITVAELVASLRRKEDK